LHAIWGRQNPKSRSLFDTSQALITLEMSDKEGATVDIVFCSLSICVPNY